jgi:uncharacterized protein YuzE
MTLFTEASYAYLAEGEFGRTVEVSDSIMVDVDPDGKPLGVEVIGDGDWRDGLAVLAMTGRLRVVPAHDRKAER